MDTIDTVLYELGEEVDGIMCTMTGFTALLDILFAESQDEEKQLSVSTALYALSRFSSDITGKLMDAKGKIEQKRRVFKEAEE